MLLLSLLLGEQHWRGRRWWLIFSNQGFYVGIHIFLQDTDGISRIVLLMRSAKMARKNERIQERIRPPSGKLDSTVPSYIVA